MWAVVKFVEIDEVIGTSIRRCSWLLLRWSTDNEVNGHYFPHYFPPVTLFFYFFHEIFFLAKDDGNDKKYLLLVGPWDIRAPRTFFIAVILARILDISFLCDFIIPTCSACTEEPIAV